MSVHKPEQRKQVLDLLRDPLTCDMGGSKIARLVGVHKKTVWRHMETTMADGPIYRKGVIEVIEVKNVRLDPEIQSRAEMRPEVVDQYVESIKAKASFPAIGVVFDGADYWVWDGFHRVKAYVRARRKTILTEIRQGTRRDAVLLSARANAEHGMMRSQADKQRAIETLLRDEEWGRWSDREIGRRCAVSPNTVGLARRQLEAAVGGLSAQSAQIDRPRTASRGGSIYTQNTANIGRSSRPTEAKVSPAETEPEAPGEREDALESFRTNGSSDNHQEPPRFASERLPLDPDAALRMIVKHFSREGVEALLRGLANWCQKDVIDKTE